MEDLKNQFIETEPVEQEAFIWASIYFYLAQAAIKRHGLEGERVIRQAIRDYGRERGRRRRNRVLKKGLEPNLISLFTNGDLNGDNRFESDASRNVLTEETRRHFVTRCPDAEMWGRMGSLQIGSIYCEEIHHYLYGCFDDAVQVNLCETLTNGGDICRFYINLRKANQKPQVEDDYVPQSWEDCEPDGIACNSTMFSLFYYHLAAAIRSRLDEETLLEGIRNVARMRGARLKELDERAGRKSCARALVEQGDLFLDPRCKRDVEVKDDDTVDVTVHRCVFAEVCACHGANEEGCLYCKNLYKELCGAYCETVELEIEECMCGGADVCRLHFKKKS